MAESLNEAKQTGRDWVAESLRFAAAQSHSVIYFPAPLTGLQDTFAEGATPMRNWEAQQQREQEAARDADGYREFVSYLWSARTPDDFLRAEAALNDRLHHYPESHHTTLSRMAVLLSAFAEGIRRSESESSAPPLNTGMLLTKIRSIIAREAEAIHLGLGR